MQFVTNENEEGYLTKKELSDELSSIEEDLGVAVYQIKDKIDEINRQIEQLNLSTPSTSRTRTSRVSSHPYLTQAQPDSAKQDLKIGRFEKERYKRRLKGLNKRIIPAENFLLMKSKTKTGALEEEQRSGLDESEIESMIESMIEKKAEKNAGKTPTNMSPQDAALIESSKKGGKKTKRRRQNKTRRRLRSTRTKK